MKTFRLLIVSLLLATSASAQHHRGERRGGDYSPTVYLISVHEVDTIYNCGGCAAQQAAARNRMAVGNATQDYIDTHRPGFQQTEKPQFVFASKNNRFSFSMGGFVALRAGYDFDGIVDNIDFVPYDIPVPGNYNSKQKLMMDASTSRLFLKAITNTRALGRVASYMDADFRGGAEGSYTPRLRSAYVSFKGLTLGRDVTTFCDLSAAPTTIDFQGPNAYNFNFATLIRYEVSFARITPFQAPAKIFMIPFQAFSQFPVNIPEMKSIRPPNICFTESTRPLMNCLIVAISFLNRPLVALSIQSSRLLIP